jgi:hypothetical protein
VFCRVVPRGCKGQGENVEKVENSCVPRPVRLPVRGGPRALHAARVLPPPRGCEGARLTYRQCACAACECCACECVNSSRGGGLHNKVAGHAFLQGGYPRLPKKNLPVQLASSSRQSRHPAATRPPRRAPVASPPASAPKDTIAPMAWGKREAMAAVAMTALLACLVAPGARWCAALCSAGAALPPPARALSRRSKRRAAPLPSRTLPARFPHAPRPLHKPPGPPHTACTHAPPYTHPHCTHAQAWLASGATGSLFSLHHLRLGAPALPPLTPSHHARDKHRVHTHPPHTARTRRRGWPGCDRVPLPL